MQFIIVPDMIKGSTNTAEFQIPNTTIRIKALRL